MNEILWRPKALRQLRKIKNVKDQATIFDAVETLKQFLEIVCIEEVRKKL